MTRGLVDIRFSMFFGNRPVRQAADRATRAVLSKAGAFVRRRAKSSIRRRKRISRPGRPPSSHAGHLKRLILFGYDRGADSVVIGPLRFRRGEAPPLLEFGGRARRSGRRMRYRARPFMGPALEAEAPNFPRLWKDSVKGH